MKIAEGKFRGEPLSEKGQAAIGFALRGFRVFPVFHLLASPRDPRSFYCACPKREACDSPGKHPMVRWRAEASADVETVADWWQRWPHANLGLALGRRSGSRRPVAVLDVDVPSERTPDREDGRQSLDETVPAWRRWPMAARTGSGGFHLWGTTRDPVGCGKPLPGVDLKGEGGYVLAPPSSHISGRRYEWLRGGDLLDDLPDLSPVLDALPSARGRDSAPRWRDVIGEGAIGEGKRNNTLCSIVGTLVARRVPPELVGLAAVGINRYACRPPLDDEEVIRIVESVYNAEGKRTRGRQRSR